MFFYSILTLLLLCSFSICADNLNDSIEEYLPGSENVRIPSKIFYKLLIDRYGEASEYIREKRCDNSTCYIVGDFLIQMGYVPYVYRAFLLQDDQDAEFSGGILKIPAILNPQALDVSKWEIDPKLLVSGPYEGCFANSISWLLDLPESGSADIKLNILMIGLGGGTFSNYLAWKYPNINMTVVELSSLIAELAVDWFAVKENEKHRIILEEGSQYVEQAVRRGERFDVILLDATYSNRSLYLVAPVLEFIQESVIRNMAKLLGSEGILLSNVVFGVNTKEIEGMQMLVDKFGDAFSNVEIYEIYKPGFNYILLARQKPLNNISARVMMQKFGPY